MGVGKGGYLAATVARSLSLLPDAMGVEKGGSLAARNVRPLSLLPDAISVGKGAGTLYPRPLYLAAMKEALQSLLPDALPFLLYVGQEKYISKNANLDSRQGRGA